MFEPLNLGSPLTGTEPEFSKREHPVWTEINPEITASEFNQPHQMDVNFLRLLSQIRRSCGVPFRFISDARHSGGASRSAHNDRPCCAVDLQVLNARERGLIVMFAIAHGIRRIGVYPGKDRRTDTSFPAHWRAAATDAGGIHLDASRRDYHPSPRLWTRY